MFEEAVDVYEKETHKFAKHRHPSQMKDGGAEDNHNPSGGPLSTSEDPFWCFLVAKPIIYLTQGQGEMESLESFSSQKKMILVLLNAKPKRSPAYMAHGDVLWQSQPCTGGCPGRRYT